MNKHKVWKTVAWMSFAASGAMYVIGSNDGHLTELKDLFFIPLPLGYIALVIAGKTAEEATPATAPAEESAPEAPAEESASE
jgi:hypothetical protein